MERKCQKEVDILGLAADHQWNGMKVVVGNQKLKKVRLSNQRTSGIVPFDCSEVDAGQLSNELSGWWKEMISYHCMQTPMRKEPYRLTLVKASQIHVGKVWT